MSRQSRGYLKISPDGKKVVLLSYGKLWTITNFSLDALSKGRIKEIDLGVRTQLESVCFTDNNTLLLSDEVRESTGGNYSEICGH